MRTNVAASRARLAEELVRDAMLKLRRARAELMSIRGKGTQTDRNFAVAGIDTIGQDLQDLLVDIDSVLQDTLEGSKS